MMALMSDPLKEHREMIASMADPLKEHREMMASMSDPLKEHREMMASMADPLKEHREMMASMADPLKEHREMIASFSDPMKKFRASLARNLGPLSEIQKAIYHSASLKSLRDIAYEVQSEIEIDTEGVVTLANKRITAADLQEISDDIFHKSSLEQSSSIKESIDSLTAAIEAQKDPLTQKILIFFIYPLIIVLIASFVNPIVDHSVKAYINPDKRALAKELKATVHSAIDDKQLLNSMRYVSADILNVRASASANAKSIAYLRFSSAVLIIEKRKNWTLIEWNDPESDAQITGWVFSRYLAKFR
jgi:hypothetical protein